VVVDATAAVAAELERIKREGYPSGRSSLPSLVGPRQGHLASGAMHPPLLLLHFPLPLPLPRGNSELSSNAPHRST